MRLRAIAAGSGLIVLLAALVHWFVIQEKERQDTEEDSYGPANVLRLQNATLNQSLDSGIRAVVWADEVRYAEDQMESNLTRVRFVVYPSQNGDVPSEPIEGSSDTAQVRGKDSTLVLVGNAHIEQGSALEFRGRRLLYDYGRGLIRSREPVWMRDGTLISEAATLEYSLRNRTARMTRPKFYE